MYKSTLRWWLSNALASNNCSHGIVNLRASRPPRIKAKAKAKATSTTKVNKTIDSLFGQQQNDFVCTNALAEAKKLGGSAEKLAKNVVSSLPSSAEALVETQVASNGFIGITLRDRWIAEGVAATATLDIVDAHRRLQNRHRWTSGSNHSNGNEEKSSFAKHVVIDFASPNVAKQLHVGHFRSIVIGDCLARVLRYAGHRVTGISHVGDFGLPIGLVLAMQRRQQQDDCGGEITGGDEQLGQLYVDAKKLADSDEAFHADALRQCRLLQDALVQGETDSDVVRRWQSICAASRAMHDRVFGRLGVAVEERGESFYAPMLDDVVAALERSKLVHHDNDALVAYFDDACRWLDPDERAAVDRDQEQDGNGKSRTLLVRKRDGGFLYSTTDLAALRHRVSTLDADQLIYVTDNGQRPHFGQVFELARRAGWYNPELVRIDHVAFGVVRGADNRKFSSRRGSAREHSLEALLADATEAARARAPELSNDDADHLGLAALRYFDLSHQHTKDYQFDVERMLSFNGNTAAYIMYAFARLNSLRAKLDDSSGNNDNAIGCVHSYVDVDAQERALAIIVSGFSDTADDVERSLAPHLLCDYAYRLATAFHQFYQHCRILDAPHTDDRARRIQLCTATHAVMSQLFDLIGIQPVQQM